MVRKSCNRPTKKERHQVKPTPSIVPNGEPDQRVKSPPTTIGAEDREETFPVVGIGASAGGFEAFKDLLQALPADTGMAFVLVQHLNPEHESMLAKLLSKATAMPVIEVVDGMAVEPDHVYVIPPNKLMGIRVGTLHLTARAEPVARNLPIDHFLCSLAKEQGSRAIGVILSGTASDGTLGLKTVKREGGITFAQDGKSAKYDGMPRGAISAGCVDFVLPPDGIARELARLGRHPYLVVAPPAPYEELLAAENDDELRRVFAVLRQATGVDFTHYRYSTIKRRIARRMLLQKVEDLAQYLQLLHKDAAEPAALCEDILIHVTGFFREPATFQALAEHLVPKLLERRSSSDPIRVWVPGCSTGEEAYSIAMVLLECLGDRANGMPVQIFGTDISEVSVETARAGIYAESSLEGVSAERRQRFFAKVAGGYRITKPVREKCVFARQDLAKDPPFSRLDVISCRNVLIYMGPVLQKRVMSIFHYALKPSGFLMLGSSESTSGIADLFTLIDRKHRICTRKPAEHGAVFGPFAAEDSSRGAVGGTPNPESRARFDAQKEADRIVLGRYAPAGMVVSEDLRVLQFLGQCSPYLSPPAGEASLSLLRMVRPELALELRTAIHRAKKQDGRIRKEGLRLERDGHLLDVCIEVVPLKGDLGERCYLILFLESPVSEPPDRAAGKEAAKPGRRETQELDRLRTELQKTKEQLQAIIEEHEATNEELKTAKEELQSTNEELVTVNDQLQNRNSELAQLTDDLMNLLTGLDIPILMLSGDWRIRRFTPQAETLLNLLPGDVGRPLDSLRPNIETPDLAGLIAEAVSHASPHEREVQDQKGHWYSIRVLPYRTLDNKTDGAVAVFIDIDAAKRTHLELQREQGMTAAVLESAGALVMVTDLEGRIVRFNRACREVSGYSPEEVAGAPFWDVLLPPEDVEASRREYRRLTEVGSEDEYETHWVDRRGWRHLISWSTTKVVEAEGVIRFLVSVGVEITQARLAEQALQKSELRLQNSEARLRQLTAGLLDAQEEERRRISRELHDDVGQRLVALSIHVEVLHRALGSSPKGMHVKLTEFQKRLEELSEDLRRTSRDLHPFALTHLGLEPALRSYCREFSGLRQLKVRFVARAMPESVSPAVALCIYRVVQEALGNAAKHAGAKRAVVYVSSVANTMRASIRDDGQGFEIDQARGKGLGLVSMEERVRHVGGTFSILPKPGKGTNIQVLIPLKTELAASGINGGRP